jgi:hypothetical protein
MSNIVDLLLSSDIENIQRPSREIEIKRLSNIFKERFSVLCKALSYDKYSEIQEKCFEITAKEPTFDLQKFQIELVYNGVFNVEDGTRLFSNKELHKKFKVPHGKELIKKLFLSGEISAIADTITELTGYSGDLIEEVKN